MQEAKEYGNQHGSTERSNIRKIKEDHVRAFGISFNYKFGGYKEKKREEVDTSRFK